jgi:hypothetical protein
MSEPKLDQSPDPFSNLEALRLDQSYVETAGVKGGLCERTWPEKVIMLTPQSDFRAVRPRTQIIK